MDSGLKRMFRVTNPPAGPLSPAARQAAWSRRARIMRRHTWLILVAPMLLCAGAGAVAYYFLSKPENLRIAVGPSSSEDVKVVQAIGAQIKENRAGIVLRPIVVEGPAEAAAAIDKHHAELAVVRRDIAMPKDGLVVAILRRNVVVFIVPGAPANAPATSKGKKSKSAAKTKEPVDKIEGLVGRRLGVIGRTPANIELLKAILKQYNIDADKIALLGADAIAKAPEAGKISVHQIDTTNVSAVLRDNSFDAIMAVGPVSSPITAEAIAAVSRGREAPTFLKIDAAEAIAERSPIYDSAEIKAGAFGGSPARPEESIDTIEIDHYIVAHRRIHETIITEFTKHLFLIRGALSAQLPAAAKIEKPDTDNDASVAVHPGASAYLDGDVKSFFDRYNDLMYWGVMLLSIFGSGFAGVLSYSKAGDRVRRLQALQRLAEIIKAARSTDAMPQVEALQDEVDGIHVNMIQQVEANALDETAIVAYAVSFEQAQAALAERRTALQGLPPPRPLAAVASR